jgi:putative endonuclease
MVHGGCVYIVVNKNHTVFYTGVTSDLYSRIVEHREKLNPSSFTSRYNIHKLVYYESFYSIDEAIDHEKQIKKYSRFKKVQLVNSLNPEWNDLFEEVSKW